MKKLLLSLGACALLSINGFAIANDETNTSANTQQSQAAAQDNTQMGTSPQAADQTSQDNPANAQPKNDDSDSDS
jgi:hypothetical protein